MAFIDFLVPQVSFSCKILIHPSAKIVEICILWVCGFLLHAYIWDDMCTDKYFGTQVRMYVPGYCWGFAVPPAPAQGGWTAAGQADFS